MNIRPTSGPESAEEITVGKNKSGVIKNRVWIELDKPRDDAHAEEICKLATAMLHKLGISAEHEFFLE
jgi:hypothetical protein